MIFDTHAHYDDEQFNEDRVELLNSMEEQGVGTIINVSATYNSCRKVIALAKEYPFVYAAVGIHPDEVGSLTYTNGYSFASAITFLQELYAALTFTIVPTPCSSIEFSNSTLSSLNCSSS